LLPGAFLIEALFDPAANHRQVFVNWAAFILAAWAVALLNPEGVAGVLFPVHMLGMKNLTWIGEWQQTDFSWIQPLELMIIAGLVLGLTGMVRLPPIRLLMLLGLIHGALTHARNEQLLGIAGVLILAEPLGVSLGRGCAVKLGAAWRHLAIGTALVAVIALVVRGAVPLGPDRTGADFAATMDHVPAPLRAKPVLNDYSLGGKLIFQNMRPFIDSRADLYGDAFLSRFRRIIWPEHDALESALSQYGIAWTIFPSTQRIVWMMDHEPGWHRLIEVDGLVIHVRDTEAAR
jgi:hypothetical protein